MSETTRGGGGGIGFTGLLQILFIALKLTHSIDWPWWLVLAPIWITVSFVVVCVAIIVAAKLILK